jgi:hypothetical protein
VPRGPPQWRHLIRVDEGASSVQSSAMATPLQILQIISNSLCASDVDRRIGDPSFR